MKINQMLYKKILRYSTMATGVIGLNSIVKSQCYYYDINPDLIITGHQQFQIFDFDGDSNPDLMLGTLDNSGTGSNSTYQYYFNYQKAYAYINNGYGGFMINSSGFPNVLQYGTPINSVGSFANSIGILAEDVFFQNTLGFSTNYQSGLWHGQTDRYLGIRINYNGNIHYGWVRMDINSTSDSIIIKDWAYRMTPDAQLGAGYTCAGNVSDLHTPLASVNSDSENILINNIRGSKGEYFIFDSQGKLISQNKIIGICMNIEISELPRGIYIIKTCFTEGNLQKKFIVH